VSFEKNRARSAGVSVQLQPLYDESRKLKSVKINDLMNLLSFVPSEHHQFYKSLKSDGDSNTVILDHPDLEFGSDQDE
jgi:hypothetical protein